MRKVVVLALILIGSTFVAAASAAPSPPDPPATCPADHPVHPPIEITEDVGPQGFAVGHEPATGEPIYRPGSGVVAGDGTEASPYVIEGWCLTPTDDTVRAGVPQAALTIQDTTAHVTVRDVVVDGQIVPRVIPGQPSWSDIEQGTPGIVVDGAANVAIEDARIENLDASAVEVADAHNVRIADNLLHGIWVTSTTGLEVRDNEVPETPQSDSEFLPDVNDGIVALDSPAAVVTGNLVRGTSDDGIVLKESPGSLVADNTVRNTLRMGIVIKSSDDVRVEDNMLDSQNFHGVKVARSGDAVVAGNTLTDNSVGMLLFHFQGLVANNTIRDQRSAEGIDLQDSTNVRIQDNRIVDNPTAGILLWKGFTGAVVDITVQRNVITGNDIGIRFGPGDDHRGNVVQRNNIHGNAQAGLAAEFGATVDATDNWWGCADGPDADACDDVTGDAVYDPWLTSPSADAGLG